MWEVIFNADHHERLLCDIIPAARKFVWIATADLKDMHVQAAKGKYIPFLAVLARLAGEGVEIRLLHAKEPGPRFRRDFDRCEELRSERFKRLLCPRIHSKIVIVDAQIAYVGSANFTGAGLGPKSRHRRNFEAGVLTTSRGAIREIMGEFDRLFLGEPCAQCQLRAVCPDPIATG
ncbi:MAG: phosphatidylserine synthase [Verrucomicrobiales bacterium]|nr:phosphatidylserine synthase [Verrucomicrobiales bacterium]